MKQICIISLSILSLSGCMVGPNYRAPCPETPAQWDALKHTEHTEVTLDDPFCNWWNSFDDPLLNQYIALASTNNRDLLAAEENILQARAFRQMAASRLYPHLSTDLNAARQRNSENGPLSTLGTTTPMQVPGLQNLFNAVLDASWEIDLFGKNRRLTEAAEGFIGQKIEKRNVLLLSLLAEVSSNYIEIRGNQHLKRLIQEQIDLLEETRSIKQRQYEAGYINALTIAQIEAQLSEAKAVYPQIQARIYAGLYALSVLTGRCPAMCIEEMQEIKPLPQTPDILAIGLQSDLLRRRPDVRQKERELASATALVGVAVASFYPSFSLTGSGGFQALKIKELFQESSKMWSIGADLLMPLFEGGRLVGQLRATEASLASTAYSYQQTVLNALQDAETSLTNYLQSRSQTDYLSENVTWNQKKVSITEAQYKQGLATLINYLDLQRELNTSEQTHLNSQIATLTSLIKLFKALGSGVEE